MLASSSPDDARAHYHRWRHGPPTDPGFFPIAVSFDVYPIAGIEKPNGADFLWYVPKGVDRLVNWTGGRKLVWSCIESGRINDSTAKPTPAQVKAEVWMALIHGSRGLIYKIKVAEAARQRVGL